MTIGMDNLGPDIDTFVDKLVESGRYSSREEVLRESVRFLQRREARLETLDAKLARGVDDIEAGRTYEAEEVFARLERKYRAMADKEYSAQVAEVRAAVARGIEDADAGRVVDAEQGFADLEDHFRALGFVQRT